MHSLRHTDLLPFKFWIYSVNSIKNLKLSLRFMEILWSLLEVIIDLEKHKDFQAISLGGAIMFKPKLTE